MGVISVGASLGVAERAAARAPSVSPLAAAASSTGSNTSHSAVSVPTNGAATATTTATATTSHHHGHARRQHEYNYNGNGNSNATATGYGGRQHKRGGRRKYAQNNHLHHASSVSATASGPAGVTAAPSVFPPPPIVTSVASMPMAVAGSGVATTPSPATKSHVVRNTNSVATASSGSAKHGNASIAAATPSQIVRAVTFETNEDPHLLAPLVLGAKVGPRLQAFMQQSKCTITHRSASTRFAPVEVVIRLARIGASNAAPSPVSAHANVTSQRRMSFTLTADTTRRVDHGVRLLQSAIETAEQSLVRKKPGTPRHSTTAAVATSVAVDSGGNGKPSSGHASASRAATPDHSIDDPPPPPRLTSSLASPASLSSHGHEDAISLDSVDERKAQTRIRYAPTNQPLKRGPGFAPSRSIAESTTSVTISAPPKTLQGVVTSKKRQLPVSGEDAIRDEPNKRERTLSSVVSPTVEVVRSPTTSPSESVPPNASQDNDESTSADDPEFDEFRIRLTRGIDFARQVDAQATRVKQRMLQEKLRYLRMIQQAQVVQHQQRVADVVIRTQCAIMATNDSNGRKRRRIEQLSAAQDALQRTLHVGQRRVQNVLPPPSRLDSNRPNLSKTSIELVELMKKVSAFREAVSKKDVKSPSKEETAPAQPRMDSSIDAPIIPSKQETEVPMMEAAAEDVHSCGVPEADESEKQNDAFRPRHLAPGVLRDMNLIQDYTDESKCALLHLLIGQRQYFYLEPISLTFGTNDLDRLQLEATRTTNDLEVIREFITKHRHFGDDLLKSIESVSSTSPQAFTSSKASSWTTMQRTLLELHPLLLALHLLALHYHAVTVLDQEKIAHNQSNPDLLTSEDEISSDLFKFVLRPIRSSAIESSLNDSLPISLVRETIAHCPEVVNHVLDWKDESDIPSVLLHDVRSSMAKKDKSSGKNTTASAMLNQTVNHLQRHALNFDRSLSELVRHIQGVRNGSISGDKVVYVVNQLKGLGARLLIANTQLQLHKWTTLFVENGFSWFDEDLSEDIDGDSVMGGDRSYDKFTCLQDAFFVWHNARLAYSAKDERGDSSSIANSDDQPCNDFLEPEGEVEPNQASKECEDPELVELRRVTPADVLNIVETKFTDVNTTASFYLTSEAIAQTRKEFSDSLMAMRASMKVLGRTAPWRTHVKHSNALKAEYSKQRELENKLLLHQWAAFYKDRPLPNRCEGASEELNTGDQKGKADNEHEDCCDEEKTSIDATTPGVSGPDADTGIVLEPGDTAEVVDMKLLRHEIENVAKQMRVMGDTSSVDADRQKLLDACNLLAASCVSALTKFLNHDEPASTVDTSRSGQAPTRAARLRANSANKADNSGRDNASGDITPSRSQAKGKQRSKARTVSEDSTPVLPETSSDHSRVHNDSRMEAVETDLNQDSTGASNLKRSKKGSAVSTARRPRAHSTSSASPRAPPVSTPAPTIPPLPNRVSASKVAPSLSNSVTPTPILAEPLRMGCSGCRDTRRRCTGCYGCCLHCVCLGCGCRMCCSSRTTSVQKTLSLLVTAVETRMGCKWIELDSSGDNTERCGMVKACTLCQQCSSHCKCHPSAQGSYRECGSSAQSGGIAGSSIGSATAGFPMSATRKERRFRINPTAAQRRQNQVTGGSDEDSSNRGCSASKRTRRSNSDATPSMFNEDSMDSTTGSDFMSSDQFSGSSTDGIPFAPAQPLPAHKNEQEDLFRAARVRMKLQRNTLLKTSHPYGLIPPNTLIEGEMLWHPDRIRLMWERKDVYGVLGVPREASTQLIKKQYRKLVLKLHPDKVAGVNESADASSPNHGEAWTLDERVSAFVAVTQAYKLLSGDIGAIHNNAWKTTASPPL